MYTNSPSLVSSGNVLLVDDALPSRQDLAQALKAVGLEVTEASEGVEALMCARKNQFNVVVTDIHMRTMNGLELIRELRGMSDYKETPIYVLTSDYSQDRLNDGCELGATAWMVKPASTSLVVEMIQDAIRQAH